MVFLDILKVNFQIGSKSRDPGTCATTLFNKHASVYFRGSGSDYDYDSRLFLMFGLSHGVQCIMKLIDQRMHQYKDSGPMLIFQVTM